LGNATAAIEGFQYLKKRCLRKSKTPDLSKRAPNEPPTFFSLRGVHGDMVMVMVVVFVVMVMVMVRRTLIVSFLDQAIRLVGHLAFVLFASR
jgi:hypothetical protein